MSEFVNNRKRGIQLPKGCKDLADVLELEKSTAESGSRGPTGNAKCDYCGGPADGGSSSSIDGKLSKQFWCEQCLTDWREFHRKPENWLPDDADFREEAVKRLVEDICRREEEFMRHRVADRKAPR